MFEANFVHLHFYVLAKIWKFILDLKLQQNVQGVKPPIHQHHVATTVLCSFDWLCVNICVCVCVCVCESACWEGRGVNEDNSVW